jgi:hemerythrin-like domain-containing protein
MERIAEAPASADHGHLDSILDFLVNFVDRCHHGKEEDLLFPALQAKGIKKEGGPIGVMLDEHRRGREIIKALGLGLEKLKKGDPSAAGEFAREMRSYMELLDGHIEKENTILFPAAEDLLSEEEDEELFKGFERLEEERVGPGKHEAFHRLLERLGGIYL